MGFKLIKKIFNFYILLCPSPPERNSFTQTPWYGYNYDSLYGIYLKLPYGFYYAELAAHDRSALKKMEEKKTRVSIP